MKGFEQLYRPAAMNNSVLEYFLQKYMKQSTTATCKAQVSHQFCHRGKLMQAKQTVHLSTHLTSCSLSAHTHKFFLKHFSFHKQHNKLLLSFYEGKTIGLGILPVPNSTHATEAFEHFCIPSTACFNKNSPFASARLL